MEEPLNTKLISDLLIVREEMTSQEMLFVEQQLPLVVAHSTFLLHRKPERSGSPSTTKKPTLLSW